MAISVHWKTLWSRIAISLILVVAFHFCLGYIKKESLVGSAGVITGLAGTLLGFLITSMSLITALMDKTLIKNMIKTGHYKRLVSDAIITCISLLILIIFCLICAILNDAYAIKAFYPVIFLISLSISYLIETGKRFASVILNIK